MNYSFLFLITCFLVSDNILLIQPVSNYSSVEWALIAHRGGHSNTFRENTFDGIKNALNYSQGVEVDVQISKDNTIWLSHSNIVQNNVGTYSCFPETRDKKIHSLIDTLGNPFYFKLEEVIKYTSEYHHDKFICIDLKPWVPCGIGGLSIDGIMKRAVDVIVSYADKYNFDRKNLLFETEVSTVLEYTRIYYPECGTFLNCYGDHKRAILRCRREGFSGVSFKYRSDRPLPKNKIIQFQNDGFTTIFWNLNSKKDFQLVKNLNVNFLQYDL